MTKNFATSILTLLGSVLTLSLAAQSGRVGIGESSPGSKGSIKGNLSVGSTYSSQPAPADGAIIEGKTGIGKTNPDEKLDVVGNVKASDKVIGTRGFVAGNVSSDTGRAVFSTDITNKGFYIPRLTTSQKNTLGGTLGVANKGLLVYDTIVNRMEYWDGVQWKAVGDSITKVLANNGLTKSGDTIQLGGALIKNTTVNQSTFNMLFSGTGVFGVGATDVGSKLNVSPGTINTAVRIGDFPAASSGKTGLAIDMTNTSTSNGIDITNLGATSMQGIRINSTANGNGTGIRIGDANTLGTGINIRGGTGMVYNALSAASGTGITIGGTTAPLNGVDAVVSGAGTGGIFQSSTAGAGVFGLSISGAYSRPALLPIVGVRGYTATNSNTASEVAYAVHGASTRYTAAGGTGTTTYGLFGSSTGNATSAGNGLMVGSYGTASVTNVGTSGAIGGLFNAASGGTNLALAANGGGDVYLGSSDADRPSNFTSGALSLGTGNTNTTRMFNARISGTQTFVGSTSGTVGITAPASITSYNVTLPNAQGAANTVLRNDGSGNLTWATGGSLLTAGTGISISGSTINNTGAVTASNGLTLSGTDVRLGGALTAATTVSGLTGTNKMSFTGTGVDAFNVDGTTFSVDATNDRVGIGTSSPSAKLHVGPGTNTYDIQTRVDGRIWSKSADAGIWFGDVINDKAGFLGINPGTNPAVKTFTSFYSYAINKWVVNIDNSNGFVGIGQIEPTARLHLHSDTTGAQVLGRFSTATAAGTTFGFANTGLNFYMNNTDGGGFQWWTSGTERVRITGAGNVGIGTASPSTLLHVAGAHATSQIRLTLPAANNGGGTGEVNLQSWVSEPCVSWEGGGIGVNVNNDYLGGGGCTGGNPMNKLNSNLGQAFIRFETNGGDMAFYTLANTASVSTLASRERMRITADGNVGIGTAAPSVRLAVNGNGVNVYATDVWVNNNMHVQGNEAINGVTDRRGRLRVGTAWNYVGLYADGVSDGVNTNNDLVLGAASGLVRVGPNGGGQNLKVSGLEGTGNRNVYADANGVLKAGTTAKFMSTTYHSYNNSSYRAPNTTAETSWLPAAGGDASDDCWNCTINYQRGWNAPYAGRLVKVIVRIQNDGGSNPDIQGVVRLNVNGTNYDGTTVISLNDSGVQTITLPATGFSFSAGDRIALGLHKRGNNSDRFEDLDIFVTAVWEYDVTD